MTPEETRYRLERIEARLDKVERPSPADWFLILLMLTIIILPTTPYGETVRAWFQALGRSVEAHR